MKRIAIFASGTGTNAEKIIVFFNSPSHKFIEVSLILSNREDAGVLTIAANHHIPTIVFNRKEFNESEDILHQLKKNQIDCIVLAGFLWLIPPYLLKAYPNRIINIHPALLPKYGGKGMFGSNVHKAVIDAQEKESGITIHYVNEQYDAGQIIFQTKCDVIKGDTFETLAKRVLQLEHYHFPLVIEKILQSWD